MAFNCQRYPKIFSLFLTFYHFLSFFYHFLSFFTTFVFIIYVTKILSKLIPTNLGTNIVSLIFGTASFCQCTCQHDQGTTLVPAKALQIWLIWNLGFVLPHWDSLLEIRPLQTVFPTKLPNTCDRDLATLGLLKRLTTNQKCTFN